MKKKVIAMMLSAALVISGAGISSLPNQTAAENNASTVVASITSGSGIDTPEVTDAPRETSEATKTPDVTDTPEETKTPDVTDTPEETKMPESTATTQPPQITPAATATPPAVVTTTTPAGITTNAALKVGDRFTTGNYIYSVTAVADGTANATVKVRGLSAEGKLKTSLTIPTSVTWQGTSYLVTGINEKSFKNNKALTSVKVGKNVTYIGKYAFQGMTSLTSVTIGSGVTTIKKYAFAGCSALRKVTIPAKTTFIGEKAFQNCKKLKAVIINSKKITKINSNAFRYVKNGCYVVVPSGKKSAYRSLLVKAKASKLKIYVY